MEIGILDPLLEGCHDDCVADAGDGVLLLDEWSSEFPEGFAFLLVDPIEIPLNSRFHKSPLEVVNEFGTEISSGID